MQCVQKKIATADRNRVLQSIPNGVNKLFLWHVCHFLYNAKANVEVLACWTRFPKIMYSYVRNCVFFSISVQLVRSKGSNRNVHYSCFEIIWQPICIIMHVCHRMWGFFSVFDTCSFVGYQHHHDGTRFLSQFARLMYKHSHAQIHACTPLLFHPVVVFIKCFYFATLASSILYLSCISTYSELKKKTGNFGRILYS